jgi:type IV pilus assembly protein PilN
MIKINLAPPVEKREQRGLSWLGLGLVSGGLLTALLAGMGIWWSILTGDVARLIREIDENQRELKRLQLVIAEHQRYRQDKDALERRINTLGKVVEAQTRPVYLMDAVASAVPAEVQLTRMEDRAQQVRFAGVAASSTALSDFMSNLKGSGSFRDIDLVESRQDLTKTPRTITFEVSARFGT